MSKVVGPLMSLEAKGTLKDTLVFQNSFASGKVNRYKKKVDEETERQLLVRLLFNEGRQRWNALSDDDKDVWKIKAKYKNKTGYDLFLQNSINNLRTMDYKKTLDFNVEVVKKGAKEPVSGIEGVHTYLEFQNQGLEANEQYVYLSFVVPRDYKLGGSFKVRMAWYSNDQTEGDVKWEMQVGHVLAGSSEKVDDAPHIYTVVDTTRPTAKELCLSDGIECGNLSLAHGDVIGVIIKRKSADVLDTLNGGARVILFRCRYISDRLGEKV